MMATIIDGGTGSSTSGLLPGRSLGIGPTSQENDKQTDSSFWKLGAT